LHYSFSSFFFFSHLLGIFSDQNIELEKPDSEFAEKKEMEGKVNQVLLEEARLKQELGMMDAGLLLEVVFVFYVLVGLHAKRGLRVYYYLCCVLWQFILLIS
jgi:hypothetical protein